MLLAFAAIVAVVALGAVALFVREAIEKRGFLKNARRKPGRIPLN